MWRWMLWLSMDLLVTATKLLAFEGLEICDFRVLKYLLSMLRSAQNAVAFYPDTACSSIRVRHCAWVNLAIFISPM